MRLSRESINSTKPLSLPPGWGLPWRALPKLPLGRLYLGNCGVIVGQAGEFCCIRVTTPKWSKKSPALQTDRGSQDFSRDRLLIKPGGLLPVPIGNELGHLSVGSK